MCIPRAATKSLLCRLRIALCRTNVSCCSIKRRKGKLLANKITWSDLELTRRLGEGQAGVVWLATLKSSLGELPPGAQVAVKQYKRWVLEQEGQYERIFRELEVGSRVHHPNLVKSYCIIADANQLPALVMRYCPGQTLEHFIRRINRHADTPPRFVDSAFQIAGSLAAAVAALHGEGIIHRDIKPANVILNNNTPTLMDLGVVSPERRAEGTVTEKFVGSIRYAAPELLFGEAYDCSADVYSIGAVFYELLSGRVFHESSKNWAKLVVARSKGEESDRVFVKYPESATKLGINASEAARHILTSALVGREYRTLDLHSLAAGVQWGFWQEHFYVTEGKIYRGEPSVSPPGNWDGYGPKITVAQAASDIKGSVTDEEVTWLRMKVQNCYWAGTFEAADGTLINNLSHAGLIQPKTARITKGHASEEYYGTYFSWQIHPAVLAAYRYGYL
jgi:serine/threonine protein kinase